MNKQIKALWVTALRSGQYKQGTGSLRKGDNFCCLGVLCDLYKKENNAGKWDEDFSFNPGDGSFSKMYLPTAVQEWAGLSDGRGAEVRIDGETLGLPYHNDGYKRASLNFQAIATAIEEQL